MGAAAPAVSLKREPGSAFGPTGRRRTAGPAARLQLGRGPGAGLATNETDPSRRAAYQIALTWLTYERGRAEEGDTSWQTSETGPLAGWQWACEALAALRARDFAAVRSTLQHAAENAGDDGALLATIAHLRGTAAYHKGHTATAWADLCDALEGFGPNHFGTGRVLDTLGMLSATRCQWPATREFYAGAQALKERFKDEAGLALTCGQLGRLALDLGELDQADLHFRAGLKWCRQTGDVRGQAQQINHRGQVWLAKCQPRETLPLLDEAIALAAGKYGVLEGYARKDRAQALLDLDRLDEAGQECDEAAERFSRTNFLEGQARPEARPRRLPGPAGRRDRGREAAARSGAVFRGRWRRGRGSPLPVAPGASCGRIPSSGPRPTTPLPPPANDPPTAVGPG